MLQVKRCTSGAVAGMLFDTGHAGLPADVDQIGMLFHFVEQQLFDLVLRDVDHRRQRLLVVLMHGEAEHFGIAVEAAAAGPRQAFLQEAVHRAQAFENLQAAP